MYNELIKRISSLNTKHLIQFFRGVTDRRTPFVSLRGKI
jgi:hypothetical protein